MHLFEIELFRMYYGCEHRAGQFCVSRFNALIFVVSPSIQCQVIRQKGYLLDSDLDVNLRHIHWKISTTWGMLKPSKKNGRFLILTCRWISIWMYSSIVIRQCGHFFMRVNAFLIFSKCFLGSSWRFQFMSSSWKWQNIDNQIMRGNWPQLTSQSITSKWMVMTWVSGRNLCSLLVKTIV